MPRGGENQECWESLVSADLNSKDPATAERIVALLRAAKGEAAGTVAAKRAQNVLYDLTIQAILAKCRKMRSQWRSRLRGHQIDDLDLAKRIFATHALGAPFLSDDPYRGTWLTAFDLARGSFMQLVYRTAQSRCIDWFRSLLSRRDSGSYATIDAAELAVPDDGWGSNPERIIEYDRMVCLVEEALEAMPGNLARDAFIAFHREGLTTAEYAAERGIAQNTANERLETAYRWMGQYFIQKGVVDPGGWPQEKVGSRRGTKTAIRSVGQLKCNTTEKES